MTEPHVRWFWRIVGWTLALVVAWFLAAWLTPWDGALGATRSFFAGSSLVRGLDSEERGVVTRFGRLDRVVGPGLQFTWPAPVERMEVVRAGRVWPTSVGFKLKDRARRMLPLPEEVEWLTGDTNLVELQAVVMWSIEDPAAFLYGVGPPAYPDDEDLDVDVARGTWYVRRAAEAAVTRRVGRMPIDEVLTLGKTRLGLDVASDVQQELAAWGTGIRVEAVHVVQVDPPQRVVAAFNDVATARADHERMKHEAEGYRAELLPEARAEATDVLARAVAQAESLRAEAAGRAAAFAELARAARLQRPIVVRNLYYRAARRILSAGRKIVAQPTADGGEVRVYVSGPER